MCDFQVDVEVYDGLVVGGVGYKWVVFIYVFNVFDYINFIMFL